MKIDASPNVYNNQMHAVPTFGGNSLSFGDTPVNNFAAQANPTTLDAASQTGGIYLAYLKEMKKKHEQSQQKSTSSWAGSTASLPPAASPSGLPPKTPSQGSAGRAILARGSSTLADQSAQLHGPVTSPYFETAASGSPLTSAHLGGSAGAASQQDQWAGGAVPDNSGGAAPLSKASQMRGVVTHTPSALEQGMQRPYGLGKV